MNDNASFLAEQIISAEPVVQEAVSISHVMQKAGRQPAQPRIILNQNKPSSFLCQLCQTGLEPAECANGMHMMWRGTTVGSGMILPGIEAGKAQNWLKRFDGDEM